MLKITSWTAETLEQRLTESQNTFCSHINTADLCLDGPFGNSTDLLLDMDQAYMSSNIFLPRDTLSSPLKPISENENESTSILQTIGQADSLEPQSDLAISDLLRTDLYVAD